MLRLTRLAILAAITVGTAAFAPENVATATTPRVSETYLTRLMVALHTCRDATPRTADVSVVIDCFGRLTGPDPKSAAELDLFRTFTSCISDAAGPDGLYDISDEMVNACLERYDVY
jgi:hypothetical protein